LKPFRLRHPVENQQSPANQSDLCCKCKIRPSEIFTGQQAANCLKNIPLTLFIAMQYDLQNTQNWDIPLPMPLRKMGVPAQSNPAVIARANFAMARSKGYG